MGCRQLGHTGVRVSVIGLGTNQFGGDVGAGDTGVSESTSGAQALARGAIEAGVALVTGYPGAPATPVVNRIVELSRPEQVQVEWTGNEKVAVEMAFGASVGGMRALLCVKGVGLNIALDPLMAYNLTGVNAGLVVLVGDDPGGWGSQNEQDSRVLALAAELPLLEPTTVADAWTAMREAFGLSEEVGLPVIVRFTRALVLAVGPGPAEERTPAGQPPPYRREFMHWVALPVNVVSCHDDLVRRLAEVRGRFESSPLNGVEGVGRWGVVAAGFAYQKLADLLDGAVPVQLRILRLATFYPLPIDRIKAFLQTVEAVLVLEETAPLVERALRDTAQKAGLTLPMYGRDTGHLPRTGELFSPHIATALNSLWPGLALPTEGECSRPRPSREPLCAGCPYVPIFDALIEVIEQVGGRDEVIITGDPGCMVRSQLPPYELMDVKHSLGSSVGMAAGVALSQVRSRTGRWVVALCGDSSFLHSGVNGLVDAARVGVKMLVLILDNGTTALSGGQPHPASPVDARGQPRHKVDIAALARAAGAGIVETVDVDRGEDIRAAVERGMRYEGVAVVIARGRCPRWLSL